MPGGGDIGEGDEGGAIGQGLGAPLRQASVGNLDLAELRGAGQRIGIGDTGLEFAPEATVMDQRQAQFGHLTEIHHRRHVVRRDIPELVERLVAQTQTAVAAIDRYGVVELVERRFLHLDQAVELGGQLQFAGLVGKQDQQAAERMRLADDA